MRKIYNDTTETNQVYAPDSVFATKDDINQLTTRIENTIQSLNLLAENLALYKEQMAESLNTEQITAINAAIQTLQATSANLGTVQVQNLSTTVKATIALLEAVNAKISSLEAQTAEITALAANSANLDEATINILTATTAIVTNWVLENISAQTIITNSATFGSATVGTLRADGIASIAGNTTVGGDLDVTGDISGHDAEFSELKSVENLVENITWKGKTTLVDEDHFILAVPHFENGQYYIQLRNSDEPFATIELFNSVDNYFVRWSQQVPGNIAKIYKDGVNENAVIYIEIDNPNEYALDIYYGTTSVTENLPGPATYTELPVTPLVEYPVTYKDGSKFFKNVDLAQQGSTVGTLRQLTSSDIDDATDNVSYDTTEDVTVIVYKPDQSLNTDDEVEFTKVTAEFLGVREFSTRNFIATELHTLNTIDLTDFDDGSIVVVRVGSTAETNMPSAAYIKETINGSPVLFDIVKTRNMPITLTNKPLVWDPTTKSIIETDTLNITNIQAHDITATNDLFILNNAIIAGDLEVRGTTFSSEVENVQSDGDWIVLRANNASPLANGDYAGIVFHNYNAAGKDAAITVDNSGTFRLSTQTTESISPLQNTWLVDRAYFYGNTDFSQATLFPENYPVTRYTEVFTDFEAYKVSSSVSATEHLFYDPTASTPTYYPNAIYNTVTQKVELDGTPITWTPDPSIDTPLEVHFYTSISFMEPDASVQEPILTREESVDLTNGAPLVWDAANEKATNTPATGGEQVWKSSVDPITGDVTYGWGTSSTGSSFVFANMAAYNTAKLIPAGQPGHIPEHALVTIEDLDNPLLGDNQ